MLVAPSAAAAQATVLAEPPPGSPEHSRLEGPQVAPTPRQGGFVLVYQSPVEPIEPGFGRYEIRSRKIDPEGRPVGEPTLVAAAKRGTSSVAPRLAYDPGLDSFLVVWREQHGIDGRGGGRVRVRRIDSQGQPNSTPVIVSSLAPRLTGADVDYDPGSRRYVVAWNSGDRVRARLMHRHLGKLRAVRTLGSVREGAEVTVGATHGSALVVWAHLASESFSAVAARTLATDDAAVGPRTRVALRRPRAAADWFAEDLDLAWDSRRRRFALAYSTWWDSTTAGGDTEANVQRLSRRGAPIGAPLELDGELNSETLGYTRIAYDGVSDAFRAVWWYERVGSGPGCRETQIRTRAIAGAWKLRPSQFAISKESDPGGAPPPDTGSSHCRVPPGQPAIAAAPDGGGWLAAWERPPYVLGLRLGP